MAKVETKKEEGVGLVGLGPRHELQHCAKFLSRRREKKAEASQE